MWELLFIVGGTVVVWKLAVGPFIEWWEDQRFAGFRVLPAEDDDD